MPGGGLDLAELWLHTDGTERTEMEHAQDNIRRSRQGARDLLRQVSAYGMDADIEVEQAEERRTVEAGSRSYDR